MLQLFIALFLPSIVRPCISIAQVENNNVVHEFCPSCIITYRGPPTGRSFASVSTRAVIVSSTLCRLFITCPAGTRAIGIMNSDPNQSLAIGAGQVINCEQEATATVYTTTSTAAATTSTSTTSTTSTTTASTTSTPSTAPTTTSTSTSTTTTAPTTTTTAYEMVYYYYSLDDGTVFTGFTCA